MSGFFGSAGAVEAEKVTETAEALYMRAGAVAFLDARASTYRPSAQSRGQSGFRRLW